MQTSTEYQQSCMDCEREKGIEHFPLGRPRNDGSRHPMRYCDECLEEAARKRYVRFGSPPQPPLQGG
jgi:hypothetical protein